LLSAIISSVLEKFLWVNAMRSYIIVQR